MFDINKAFDIIIQSVILLLIFFHVKDLNDLLFVLNQVTQYFSVFHLSSMNLN